jgi:hypothetical protein
MNTIYEKFHYTSSITATAVPTRCNEALSCFKYINQQNARSKMKWNTNHKTRFILSAGT